MIDLRSDTVTRPTAGMLKAMFDAEVGDDVLGDDPTVKRLEQAASEFLGQQAALFLPTGTMANTVGLKTWTQPGDELILDRRSHTYNLESAANAALCGLSYYPVDTADGILSAEQVESAVRPANIHAPVTRVVVLENTHNLGGGTCYSVERVREIREVARKHGLILHMDGARLANASVATGAKPADYGRLCDSVTQCLSKGLGCPVGTMLAGRAEYIQRARRYRKMFGGGMRQSGYLAAAGLYALRHHVDRLSEDHAKARRLADGLSRIPGLEAHPERVQTNMVYFSFRDGPARAARAVESLKGRGVLLGAPRGATVRAVTHLDVSEADVDQAAAALREEMR